MADSHPSLSEIENQNPSDIDSLPEPQQQPPSSSSAHAAAAAAAATSEHVSHGIESSGGTLFTYKIPLNHGGKTNGKPPVTPTRKDFAAKNTKTHHLDHGKRSNKMADRPVLRAHEVPPKKIPVTEESPVRVLKSTKQPGGDEDKALSPLKSVSSMSSAMQAVELPMSPTSPRSNFERKIEKGLLVILSPRPPRHRRPFPPIESLFLGNFFTASFSLSFFCLFVSQP